MDNKDNTRTPYFQHFLQRFTLFQNPGLHNPPVWFLISKKTERHAQLIHYVERHMKDYVLTSSTYYIHPNEWLYANNPKGKGKHREVHLAFLFKKRVSLPKPDTMYVAPRIDYYTELHRYNECLFNLSERELRMEFYLDIMELFYLPRDSVYYLFGGSKTMHAANISFPNLSYHFLHLSSLVYVQKWPDL